MENPRLQGTVLWINPAKGYGMIHSTPTNHYFSFADVQTDGVGISARVTFLSKPQPTKKHPRAKDVRLIEEKASAA